MAMQALRDGASGGLLKYFLLGILCLAAGGLVFTDVGGFFRGGISGSDVAKIGNQTLSIQQFDRTLRSATQRLGLSPQQAHQLGYTRELLNGEIRNGLLLQKAADTGINVSTAQVAGNIQKLLQPMAQPGQDPRDVLVQLLRSQGISEQQLANSIRSEMSINMMGNAIQSGFLSTSDTMAKDLARHESETRDVQYIVFKDKDFKSPEEPSEEKIREFYEKTKEAYAIPEMRKSRIVFIETDNLKESLEISDEEIQDVYERNISSYSEPEKRKIEQVILADAAKAEEIAKLVNEGKSLKDATKEVTGNTTDYLPAKDVQKTELLEELRDDVFDADEKATLGPLESGLGNHVIVVQKKVEARTTPLAEVRREIKEELIETRLLDAQYDLANTVDDALAAGEDLETLKEELNLEIKEMAFSNKFGVGENGKAVFTGAFGPDAQIFVSALYELNEGEASPVQELADGRMAALLVDEIKPKTYTPFEELKDDLTKRWINDSRRVQNKTNVLGLVTAAKADGTALDDIAKTQSKSVQNLNGLKRTGEPKKPLTAAAAKNVFEAPVNELFIIDLDDGAAIATINKSSIPDTPKKDSVNTVSTALLQKQQSEAYTIFIEDLNKHYGVRVNEKLLNAAYAQQDN